MESAFAPEGSSSIPKATKDWSVRGVCACKICGSENGKSRGRWLVIYHGVVFGKNFPPLSETYQNCGDG